MITTAHSSRRQPHIRQAIFSGTASADGAHLTFASLADGRCALLREGELIAAWGSDVYGLDVGVREFLVATKGDPAVTALPARPHARPPRKALATR